MTQRPDARAASAIAMAVAATMIAQQVAGKATRDALFLSNFSVTRWPAMLVAAALISIALAVVVARGMGRVSPERLVPRAFAVSAVLLLGIWLLSFRDARAAAIGLYLHIAALGPVLVSGFWSMFNERFDPRTAKREIGRIGAVGTLGGLLGGVLAAQIAQRVGVSSMIPVLAGMHVFCAVALLGFSGRRAEERGPRPSAGLAIGEEPTADFGVIAGADTPPPESLAAPAEMPAGLKILTRSPYLTALAVMIVLGTVSAALLDYVFRVYATAGFPEEHQLIQVFSWFYAAVALGAFLVQSLLSRLVLGRMRLAETVAMLPMAVVGGGVGVLLAPGFLSAAIARGLEMVVRNSLFRSGYELLYAPLPSREKRATKTIIDVGFERLGDAIGGGVVAAALLLSFRAANGVLLGIAVVLGLAAIVVAYRLHRGYLATLESRIARGAASAEAGASIDMTQTMSIPVMSGRSADETGAWQVVSGSGAGHAAPAPRPNPPVSEAPPELQRFMERVQGLHSTDPSRARRALAEGPLDAELVPHALPLLGVDGVAQDAARALRAAAPAAVGQLVDWLVDPARDFAVRRRIPRLLSENPSERAIEGLFRGLEDPRFEIRLRCGRALARIREASPDLTMDRERAIAAVRREVAVERSVWESQREIARLEDSRELPSVERFLRQRASASLEHVFTLLSVALPQQPLLRIAYHELTLDDAHRRGTALEYLEIVIPPDIRERLWPFLEEGEKLARSERAREEIIADLTRSHESIQINLAELRKLEQERKKSSE